MNYLEEFDKWMINQGWNIDYRGLLFKDNKLIDAELYIKKRKEFYSIFYSNTKQLTLF